MEEVDRFMEKLLAIVVAFVLPVFTPHQRPLHHAVFKDTSCSLGFGTVPVKNCTLHMNCLDHYNGVILHFVLQTFSILAIRQYLL